MSPPHPHSYFSNLGLGYSIAIALAFLFLLSTLLLSSYLCCRARRNRTRAAAQAASRARSADGGVILPRVIFVAEDEDEEEESAAVGLEQSVINSYPRFEFSNREGARSNNTTCSICLCEYKDSEIHHSYLPKLQRRESEEAPHSFLRKRIGRASWLSCIWHGGS
ncbi:RING-H2 finger protein ATL67 [Cajanus cajan]|uniref:RING-H2 finger protein ATL3K n=1 Tax=Cajanus cajan TaxID=3821 RepID=A0A151RYW7_CAJCA|nr:RING-H2 finger protein ATL67 [Cajanus cajan]KYP47637.1 RING-H2 finger protein ATL3K [Cajanus cajan]